MSNAGSSFGNGGRATVRRLSLLDGLRCAATGQPRAANRAYALTALASEKRFGLTMLSAALDEVALAAWRGTAVRLQSHPQGGGRPPSAGR